MEVVDRVEAGSTAEAVLADFEGIPAALRHPRPQECDLTAGTPKGALCE